MTSTRPPFDPPPTAGSSAAFGAETIAQDLFCQECGYNLRGLTSDRCPECGEGLGGIRETRPQIPWVYRRETGWLRAYWRTVYHVLFREKQFCEELCRPVSYRDAQSFRWVTVLHAALPAIMISVVLVVAPPTGPLLKELKEVFAAGWPLIVWNVSLLLWLAAATGLPSYFFHPRGVSVERQNRALALSYYACAPLAVTPIAAALALGAAHVQHGRDTLLLALTVYGGAMVFGEFLVWWLMLGRLARRLLPEQRSRAMLVSLFVPVRWGLAALAAFAAPWPIIYYGRLIWASFEPR